MRSWSLTHLSDGDLRRDLCSAVTSERTSTAAVVAHLAEFASRKLYLPEGYDSMRAYCVGALGRSEDSTWKRPQAARAAARFPEMLDAIAEGRLHLSGVCLLAPHLTPENAGELLSFASGKTKAQIEALIAERFPRSESLPLVQPQPVPRAPGTSGNHRAHLPRGRSHRIFPQHGRRRSPAIGCTGA